MASKVSRCAECLALLERLDTAGEGDRKPCPMCGSLARLTHGKVRFASGGRLKLPEVHTRSIGPIDFSAPDFTVALETKPAAKAVERAARLNLKLKWVPPDDGDEQFTLEVYRGDERVEASIGTDPEQVLLGLLPRLLP